MLKVLTIILSLFLYSNTAFSQYPTQPREVIGIGRDYTWTTGGQRQFIEMLKKCRLNTTSIELAGWGFDDTKKGQTFLYRDGIDKIRPFYEELVNLCREYDILLIVSVVNDNKGSGKYGDNNRTLSFYKKEVEDAMNMVLSYGSEGVWVQTVAETQTPYGFEIEEKWIPIFKQNGFKVIWNRFSRPIQPQLGADFFAYHNCTLTDFGRSGCILIPDCGNAIGTYTVGGLKGKTLNPNVLFNFTRNVKGFGDRGLCIYTGWTLQNIRYIDALAISFGWGNWRIK